MFHSTSFGGRRNDAAFSDDTPTNRDPNPSESYVIKVLMRRARISGRHAAVVAELAGIVREISHG